MKNKNALIIILSMAVLAAAVAFFAILNARDIQEKKESQEKAEVKITVDGEEKAIFTLSELKQYEKTVFDANLDKSGEDPVKKSFGGVPLNKVLQELGVSLAGDEDVIFVAADGYTTVVTAKEAMDQENVYLVYERDGKPSGDRASGGSGPIEIVIAKDQFSQRWCKYLMEVKVNAGS